MPVVTVGLAPVAWVISDRRLIMAAMTTGNDTTHSVEESIPKWVWCALAVLVSAVAVTAVLQFTDHSVEGPKIGTATISRLRVEYHDGAHQVPIEIDDPRQIAAFQSFIDSLDAGWYQPWDTMPALDWTIAIEDDDRLIGVLYVSETRIGTKDALRDLSFDEWQQLKTILEAFEQSTQPEHDSGMMDE